jgi:hypothetical protein
MTNTTLQTKPLSASECKNIAFSVITDKRKSLSLFKSMTVDQLELVQERLQGITIEIKEKAEIEARQKREEQEKVESAIHDTLEHLRGHGFNFSQEDVTRLLSKMVKPVKDKPLVSAPLKAVSSNAQGEHDGIPNINKI